MKQRSCLSAKDRCLDPFYEVLNFAWSVPDDEGELGELLAIEDGEVIDADEGDEAALAGLPEEPKEDHAREPDESAEAFEAAEEEEPVEDAVVEALPGKLLLEGDSGEDSQMPFQDLPSSKKTSKPEVASCEKEKDDGGAAIPAKVKSECPFSR